jgi:cell division protein FtsQ
MARSRASVTDRPSRWRLLLRRQRWLARPFGMVCLGLAVAVTGAIFWRHSETASPGGRFESMREWIGGLTADAGMRVKDIVVEGRANTPEPILRAAMGFNKGDPIIGFSLEQARLRIEKLAWVAHATIERRLPNTIVVSLVERRPFAIWQNQGRYILIDRDGQPVTDEEIARFRGLPLIVGTGAPEAARELLDALTERPSIQSRIVAAMRISERRWNLRMKNGTDILLPEGHEIDALDRLLTLQQDTALLDRPLQSIDMRLGDRLVLHPLGTSPGTGSEKPTPIPPAPKKPT